MLQSQSTVKFTGNIKRRWDALNCDVDTANTELAALNITRSPDGVITGILIHIFGYKLQHTVNSRILVCSCFMHYNKNKKLCSRVLVFLVTSWLLTLVKTEIFLMVI